nr:hypothetical protein [Tanacetum cinerariifolium]
MKLELEHSQQGSSYEVSIAIRVPWCRPMRNEGCATWDGGNSTWGGRARVIVGFNSLVDSLRALSTLRRSGLKTASKATKPCQGDSSKLYLITGSEEKENLNCSKRWFCCLRACFLLGASSSDGSHWPATENPSEADAETTKSQEDRSLHIPPHDSDNRPFHDDGCVCDDEETNSLRLRSFVDQSGMNLTLIQTEVFQSSPGDHSVHLSPSVERAASRTKFPLRGAHVDEGESFRNQAYYVLEWSIHKRCRIDTPMWCRELMTDILERFKDLQADYDQLAETYSECEETVRKLAQVKSDLEHNANLYINMADQYKMVKSEHDGCAEKLEVLENQNSELSQVNKDQALRIRELEDELARKDSALVYAERINTERAQEKEKLVVQLSKTEMEKFDCTRKLLPTMVDRFFQSHEYKQSLSKPFNLAIQARWAKGLAKEHSDEDLSELMSRMEGFDAYADKKMFVENEILFKKRYPFVEKISRGFHHTVSDLIKVYPDSLSAERAPPSKPSSRRAPSSSALNKP